MDAFFQGFDPLPTQRVSPLYCFEIFIFSDGPFGLWRQKKLILKGSTRQKNAISWGNFFKKCLKKAFFGPFLQGFAYGAQNLAKKGLLNALGELGKSILSTLIKVVKFFGNFLKMRLLPLRKSHIRPWCTDFLLFNEFYCVFMQNS